MKKQLALCLSFFCSFCVVAQEAISWSPVLDKFVYVIEDMLFFKDHGYMLRINGVRGIGYTPTDKGILHQLDKQLNITKELEIDLEYKKKKAEMKRLIVLNDKLYLFYTGYKDKEKILLLSEINPDNLDFTGAPIILGTVKSGNCQVLMEQSENGHFFSVFAYWGDDGASKAYVTCYDNNFQNIYEDEKDIDMRYAYNGCSQLVVDDEGNTFAIMDARVSLSGINGMYSSKPDGPPVFWQRYKSGESIVRAVKDEKNKYLIQKARVVVSNEVVLLAGYFTEQDFKDDRVRGIAFMAYDKSVIGNAKQAEVPVPKDISKYLGQLTKGYKKSEEEIPALTIIDLKDWEGHGYLVVGERQFTYSSGSTFKNANTVAFISLVDYSLSKVHWTIPVCKYFNSDDPAEGLYLILEADKASVFFNSTDKFNQKYDEAILYGDGVIQMTINPEGAHNTRVFLEAAEGLKIRPNYMKPIDGKSWFVVGLTRALLPKQRLGIIRP